MGGFRILLAAALVAATAACSPYNYADEVADLNKSVAGLKTSVTSGHQSLIGDATASRRRDLVYYRRPVDFPPSCSPKSPTKQDLTCGVYRQGHMSAPADPYPIPQRLTDALTALTNYTTALAAVTKASDRAEFDAAVGKLNGSLTGLLAFTPQTAVAAPVVSAAFNLFAWIVGTALDHQRFVALRNAVNFVEKPGGPTDEKPLEVIAGLLDLRLSRLVQDRRNQLYEDAALVQAKIGGGISEETYRARLSDLESILAKIEELRRSDPAGATQGLLTAHKALADAVNNPKLDLGALLKTLGELKDKVTALQKALAALS